MSRIGASSTSEITTRASAARSPERIRSRIARQLVPLPEPRIPIGSLFTYLTIKWTAMEASNAEQAINLTPVLANPLQQAGSRIPGLKWDDSNFGANLFQNFALFFVKRFRCVVTTFHINVWLARGNKLHRPDFRKDCDEINALQSRKDFRAIAFPGDGPPLSLQFSN